MERIDGDRDEYGVTRYLFYYSQGPDYSIHFVHTRNEGENSSSLPNDINEGSIESSIYYVYSF